MQRLSNPSLHGRQDVPIPEISLQSTIGQPPGVVIQLTYTWPSNADHAMVKTEVRAAGSKDLLGLSLGGTFTLEDTAMARISTTAHLANVMTAVADMYGWAEPF